MYYFRKDLFEKKPVNINIQHKKHMLCLNESTLNPFQTIKDKVLEKL